MNSDKIDRVIRKLERTGVVPLDEVFELVGSGINYRDLEEKHSITRKRIDNDKLRIGMSPNN